jgi:hypothetical protein
MSGMESFWGRDWGELEAVGNILWVNRQICPSQNYFLYVGEVTWGLPTQKEMKKNCPKKSRVLGLGLPHLPEQHQDY